MASVSPVYQGKNGNVVTMEALTAVLGGQLVIPQTGATTSGCEGCQPAGAGAANCVGVASSDGVPTSAQAGYVTGTSAYDAGYPLIDTSVPDPTVAIYNDVIIPVTYTAVAVAYGASLKCAASGAVAAWVSGTDAANLIIGRCMQPGGVSSAGGVALALIRA